MTQEGFALETDHKLDMDQKQSTDQSQKSHSNFIEGYDEDKQEYKADDDTKDQEQLVEKTVEALNEKPAEIT